MQPSPKHQSKPNTLIPLLEAVKMAGYTVYEADGTGNITWHLDTAQTTGLRQKDLETFETQSSLYAALGERGEVRRHHIENAQSRIGQYRIEYQLKRQSARPLWIEERGRWIETENGLRLVGAIRSISERKRREARLEFLTSHDELTGVYNRMRMREELEAKIAECVRSEQHWVYLLAGIDDLGFVNTDYGFDIADQVIAAISQRLKQCLGSQDAIGRVAGAKFGMAVQLDNIDDLSDTVQTLINAVREPVIETSAGPVAVSISLGGVWLSVEHPTSEDTMTAAENALNDARAQGKGGFSLATETTTKIGKRRRNATLADGLVSALNEGRIHLAFQPIVDAQSRLVRHYEALIRLEETTGKIRPAGEFIEAAENLGLIHLLDIRALELAMKALDQHPDIHVAVNVSAASVQDSQTADPYLGVIENRPDLAKRMIFELTETCLAADRKRTAAFISRLREAGARFSIDDFGAGYTSFQNLMAFDVDQVKIDGAFIQDFHKNPQNQTFVRTLLDLAQTFRLETVAEWVDCEEDAIALRDMGVDALQGFYMGKPELKFPS